ncbi:galactose mutarotase-like protein [Dendrothele bispora CBS 962.96]|uniref:rhamnogalacturonan endolyase n=1 Tax=Dendrothele bispora (strain CBS 962.96) TaxID=1314807 RepID=A0A4S8MDZ2_DENBC|nr:galactose mutarotase-like protein [Dendrothele bispora CBS 962.96]
MDRMLSFLLSTLLFSCALAVVVQETSSIFRLSNEEISFDLVKATGVVQNLTYRGVSLLGSVSGNTGKAYTDFPSNLFSLTGNSSFDLVNGPDWSGVVFTDNDTSGSIVQRSWFLRDTEAGLHSFVRLAYYNATVPFKGALGESRTMFRPNGGPWTHLVTNHEQWAPEPSAEALANEIEVQDATWYLGSTPNDPYVIEESDYWTKYTFADNQTNKAHGLFGRGPGDLSLGAWWVVNQKDTFFGGPLHVDLMVDGIIYNKQSTSHGGATSPNITDGFDRTFGPQFLYFNNGQNASLHDLLEDAEQLADPSWNADFYDEIAPYVVGYVSTSARGSLSGRVQLPEGASNAIAVLSANGVHFQDSAADPRAYQYWVPLDPGDNSFNITRVKEGTYRLTVYADGIFGDFIKDDVVINAGLTTNVYEIWVAESAGREIWRIGVPDKSSGEFRNGYERDETHPNHPAKYRIYWGAWDFPTQFPQGVNFTVGVSNENVDWNYIHWSQFGPTFTRNETVTDFNKWHINFDLSDSVIINEDSIATLTIQLAAAKTTAGNTDANTGSNPSFPILIWLNDQETPLNWTIQAYESSSCGQRSGKS